MTARRSATDVGIAFGLLGVLATPPAQAALGGAADSVQSDALRWQGVRRQSAGLDHVVHEIVRSDGSRIREYVNAQGTVFMVSWSLQGKPRMAELLGAFEPAYRDAAGRSLARPGIRHQAHLEAGDLVVRSRVHLNRHVGTAYLRSMLPGSLAAQARR